MRRGATVASLEAAARRARRVELAEAEHQESRRHLRWWYQGGEGFRLSGQLPAADGAVVVAALERVASKLPERELEGQRESYFGRLGDALVCLASSELSTDPDADRACVVLRVEASALTGDGRAELDGGHPIHAEIARRLSCDGRLEVVLERDGVPVGVGRARRTIPAWLWRLLKHRDGGRCRFCGSLRWLRAHHIRHWARGGRTDLDNLLTCCDRCHRLFHEGGWTIEGDPNGRLIFRRPDGRVLACGPPGLRPSVREATLGAVSARTLHALAGSTGESLG